MVNHVMIDDIPRSVLSQVLGSFWGPTRPSYLISLADSEFIKELSTKGLLDGGYITIYFVYEYRDQNPFSQALRVKANFRVWSIEKLPPKDRSILYNFPKVQDKGLQEILDSHGGAYIFEV